jgi:hypothetical protein
VIEQTVGMDMDARDITDIDDRVKSLNSGENQWKFT